MFVCTRIAVVTVVAVALVLGVPSVALEAAPQQPSSVAFWYAPQAPLEELAQFDWVVLEPGHLQAEDVHFLEEHGAQPFAYLSIGELDADQARLHPEVASAAVGNNAAWGSRVMDLSSPIWRDYLIGRAGELQAQGYRGLFLDTLDSFNLLPTEQREQQRLALAALLRELHSRFPGLPLLFNRGFEVLDDLPEVAAGVAVESLRAGWDASSGRYLPVPDADREWLTSKLKVARERGLPVVAIEYLPPAQRQQARELAAQLAGEGYLPYVATPAFDTLGVSTLEVQPRRIAFLYDPREGDLPDSPGHIHLGGLLEYLGYRVDYLTPDELPTTSAGGRYAGVVVWMTSGAPLESEPFEAWLSARLDEQVPVAFFAGLPLDNAGLMQRIGVGLAEEIDLSGLSLLEHDGALLGGFEAPLKLRSRGLLPYQALGGGLKAGLKLQTRSGQTLVPVAVGEWGGYALNPFVFEENPESRRWILDPFVFVQRALRLPALPVPDTTTENGRRIATVHIDGDGFPSRAEVTGTPYAGQHLLDAFIEPYPLLSSVSIVEGEIGPRGMYPHLANELEPIARALFAHPRVEVASHTFSHPFFWQPEKARQREDFNPEYGFFMQIPGYRELDLRREIFGTRDYINERLTTTDKPVKMIFWSGDALPSEEAIRLAYEAGLPNVNGGVTALTRANPSLSNLYPLLRPTSGGLQIYAPIINENVYTNLWHGPYYGFKGVIDTFELTDSPRRLRGLHLYYHFYSATKQASLKVMADIYRHMLDQQPISLWMSDYLERVRGLYHGSLARTLDGRWQIRGMRGMRTLRLDPALGWPDLGRSQGVAGVRDLPQGRYVHLASDRALLALRDSRDPRPALEEANIPLLDWTYLSDKRVRLSFAGEFPLQLSVRSASRCRLELPGRQQYGRQAGGLWHFQLATKQVKDGQLVCE